MVTQRAANARILELARKEGVLRVRDVIAEGIHPEYLRRLTARGLLLRLGRGMYAATDAPLGENHSLAEACKRVPAGVVCLLSALQFHDLTTQWPAEVWLAIDRKARLPRVDTPPLRVVRFSGRALTYGVEEHLVEGVRVKVSSAAKTVADCFKYRNKIGRDVAVEALRDCRAHRRATADELWEAAKVCRVANVLRPYLECIS